jgi:hypothetical protein
VPAAQGGAPAAAGSLGAGGLVGAGAGVAIEADGDVEMAAASAPVVRVPALRWLRAAGLRACPPACLCAPLAQP